MNRGRRSGRPRVRQPVRSSSPVQEEGAGESAALPPRIIPEKMDVRLIKDFKALIPPVFRGGINFLEAEHWLKEVKKILDVLEVPEERRVSLASFMLREKANSWWDMVKNTYDVPHMGWTQFKDLLLAKYFPEAMRRQKRLEFVHFQQGGMTVAEYASKFTLLSGYAQHVVVSEHMRAEQLHGLRVGLAGSWRLRNCASALSCWWLGIHFEEHLVLCGGSD